MAPGLGGFNSWRLPYCMGLTPPPFFGPEGFTHSNFWATPSPAACFSAFSLLFCPCWGFLCPIPGCLVPPRRSSGAWPGWGLPCAISSIPQGVSLPSMLALSFPGSSRLLLLLLLQPFRPLRAVSPSLRTIAPTPSLLTCRTGPREILTHVHPRGCRGTEKRYRALFATLRASSHRPPAPIPPPPPAVQKLPIYSHIGQSTPRQEAPQPRAPAPDRPTELLPLLLPILLVLCSLPLGGAPLMGPFPLPLLLRLLVLLSRRLLLLPPRP